MKDKAKRKRLATFDLQDHNMEALEDVSVDDVVVLEITAKMARKQEGEYPSLGCGDEDCEICYGGAKEGGKKINATFEIQKIVNKGVKGQKQFSQKEAGIAAKYNELVKKGVAPSTAMQRAMKG